MTIDEIRRTVEDCPCDGDCSNWSCGTVIDLLAEIDRVKRGDLTPEEFQSLCHNLHERGTPCTRQEFEQGCVTFADQLFGTAQDYCSEKIRKT